MKLVDTLKQKLKELFNKTKDSRIQTLDDYKSELMKIYELEDIIIMKPLEPVKTIGSVVIYDRLTNKIIETFEVEKVIVFSFTKDGLVLEKEFDYEEVDIFVNRYGLQELAHGVCKNSDIYSKYPLILTVGTSYIDNTTIRLGSLIYNTLSPNYNTPIHNA